MSTDTDTDTETVTGAPFAVVLEALRRGRGLSQRKLAALSGVMPATIAKWLEGGNLPTLRHAARVAKALGVSLGTFDNCPDLYAPLTGEQ